VLLPVIDPALEVSTSSSILFETDQPCCIFRKQSNDIRILFQF
jgi:hypothetical protein